MNDAKVLGGGFVFSNRLLRLTPSVGGDGPLWQITPQPVNIEGREPDVIHAAFGPVSSSHDGSAGWLSENEHGFNGDFYFEPPYFDLLQSAALSAADLEIGVFFAALNGRVENLMISIENKTA